MRVKNELVDVLRHEGLVVVADEATGGCSAMCIVVLGENLVASPGGDADEAVANAKVFVAHFEGRRSEAQRLWDEAEDFRSKGLAAKAVSRRARAIKLNGGVPLG